MFNRAQEHGAMPPVPRRAQTCARERLSQAGLEIRRVGFGHLWEDVAVCAIWKLMRA